MDNLEDTQTKVLENRSTVRKHGCTVVHTDVCPNESVNVASEEPSGSSEGEGLPIKLGTMRLGRGLKYKLGNFVLAIYYVYGVSIIEKVLRVFC